MMIEDAGGKSCWITSWTGNIAKTVRYVKYKSSQTRSGRGSHECLFACQAEKIGKANKAIAFITSHMLTTVEGLPNAHLSIESSSERLKMKAADKINKYLNK